MESMKQLIEGMDSGKASRLLKWLDQINWMMKDSVNLDSNLMRFVKSAEEVDKKKAQALQKAFLNLRGAFDDVTDALYDIREDLKAK
jgi:hypothetical protein